MVLPLLLIGVTLTISPGTPAWAQDRGLDKPQPEHKLLERLAGEWHFERRSVPKEGSQPQTLGKGVISAELVGGFFVVSRWAGTLYGVEYKAFQSLGYDIQRKKYSGYWLDSFISFCWELEGSVDQETRELILTASGPAPNGGTATFRERYQFNSDGSIAIIGEMQRGAAWVQFTTTLLSRRR